nr:hypothetical protein [Tanacetum cinerariifolium]
MSRFASFFGLLSGVNSELKHDRGHQPLSWSVRANIALDAGRGLQQLRKIPGQTEPTPSAEVEFNSCKKRSQIEPPTQMESQVVEHPFSGNKERTNLSKVIKDDGVSGDGIVDCEEDKNDHVIEENKNDNRMEDVKIQENSSNRQNVEKERDYNGNEIVVFDEVIVVEGNVEGIRTEESRQNDTEEKRKIGILSKDSNDGKADSKGFILVQKRKNDQMINKWEEVECGKCCKNKEVEDVYNDDTGMGECMAKDVLETHIKAKSLNKIGDRIFGTWDCAWKMMGDMNVTMVPNEHSTGGSGMTSDMNKFRECANNIEIEDIASFGLFFTWTKNLFKTKTCNYTGVLKKLDRDMGNEGCQMFQTVKKLRSLKRDLKKLTLKNGNIFDNVISLKNKLKEIQTKIDKDPHDKQLRSKESSCLHEDKDGNMFRGNEVAGQFVKYFQEFLGSDVPVKYFEASCHLIKRKLSTDASNFMVRDVCDDEIKEALFHIDNNKDPSPNGKMLKEINSTLISLIPKLQTPDKVTDFRPIACCNVIYKCISKVITNRMKTSLNDLVGLNRSAYIPNRHIQDNILLSQELLKGYERKDGPNRDLAFMKKWFNGLLVVLQLHPFLLMSLGEIIGYFREGRGLRQGDPMSLYLFTLVMEILTLIVHDRVDKNKDFKYHFGCKKMKLTHVFFADDLLIFCNGDKGSVSILKEAVEEFGSVSGLLPNYNKSTIIFGSMTEEAKQETLKCAPFRVEKLSVKYLGVPLTSKRLGVNNCQILLDKIKSRILN